MMHYNFWDDPEPHPEAQTLFYVRESAITGQNEIAIESETEKTVIRVTDITGREIHPETRGVIMIIQYSDGTSEKRYIY